MGSGTVTSAENRAVIDQSTGVIERTNAAPSRAADWGTMASPMGPIVVDSGTPTSLGGLPEPQVRKNLFAAGPIRPLLTNSTLKTVESSRSRLIPMAIWVRLERPWP